MKTVLISISLWFALVSSALAIGRESFEKTIEREFSAQQVGQLQVDNRYGDIKIITEETDKVAIRVSIQVLADSEEEAQDYFEKIHINISHSHDAVLAQTRIEGMRYKKDFKINYEIHLPLRIYQQIENKFGNIYCNKLAGKHLIDLSYGNLKIDEFINTKEMERAVVRLAYAKGAIGYCEWLKVELKYSKLRIDRSQALILNSKYSDINIEECSSLVVLSKYDSPIKIGRINNIKAEAAYSTFVIDELRHKIMLELKYSDCKVRNLASTFRGVQVAASYSDVKIPIPSNASFGITAYAKYGDINLPQHPELRWTRNGQEVEVSGTVGQANDKAVSVKLTYGSIDLAP